ncbi:hypothetical protein [Enterococcus olivae]
MNTARRAIERLYRDRCTIKGAVKTKRNGATETSYETIVEDQKCKVSLQTQRPAVQGVYAEINFDAKLFIRPEVDVPENAEIVVTDMHGRVTKYTGSKAFGYPNHQEIYLHYSEKVK